MDEESSPLSEEMKANPSGISRAELKLDIDYVMHIEHEVPMEYFTNIEKMKEDIVTLMLEHANQAVLRAERELRYAIGKTLREEAATFVDNISSGAMRQPAPREVVDEIAELMKG